MNSVSVAAFDYTPTLPTANQYVIILDSTRFCYETVANSASLVATAGSARGLWPRVRVDFVVNCTTQNVTVVRQGWSGGAWVTVASGSETVTAGTPFPKGWMPETPDWRIYVLAGGTAPATLSVAGTLTSGDAASGA